MQISFTGQTVFSVILQECNAVRLSNGGSARFPSTGPGPSIATASASGTTRSGSATSGCTDWQVDGAMSYGCNLPTHIAGRYSLTTITSLLAMHRLTTRWAWATIYRIVLQVIFFDLLLYKPFHSLADHRPLTTHFHQTRFWACAYSCFQRVTRMFALPSLNYKRDVIIVPVSCRTLYRLLVLISLKYCTQKPKSTYPRPQFVIWNTDSNHCSAGSKVWWL